MSKRGSDKNCNGHPRDLGKPARERLYKLLRERDGDNCCFCHRPIDFTLRRALWGRSFEHRHVRWSAGGSWDPNNLALAHKWCNHIEDHNWRLQRFHEEVFLKKLPGRIKGGHYHPAWFALTTDFLGELD